MTTETPETHLSQYMNLQKSRLTLTSKCMPSKQKSTFCGNKTEQLK